MSSIMRISYPVDGRFGKYGGKYIPETLVPAVEELESAYEKYKKDPGFQTLKDAINEALRDWITNLKNTYYLIGSVVGPHPYPMMVRDFQSVIGQEIKQQILEISGNLPNAIVACVGGGSNAIGTFSPF